MTMLYSNRSNCGNVFLTLFLATGQLGLLNPYLFIYLFTRGTFMNNLRQYFVVTSLLQLLICLPYL